MVYREMYARLGNQLFRYTATRALIMKLYILEEQLVIKFQQIYDAGGNDFSFYNVLENFNVA